MKFNTFFYFLCNLKMWRISSKMVRNAWYYRKWRLNYAFVYVVATIPHNLNLKFRFTFLQNPSCSVFHIFPGLFLSGFLPRKWQSWFSSSSVLDPFKHSHFTATPGQLFRANVRSRDFSDLMAPFSRRVRRTFVNEQLFLPNVWFSGSSRYLKLSYLCYKFHTSIIDNYSIVSFLDFSASKVVCNLWYWTL